jgi:sarcosine oxidase gamma subunit
MRPDPAEEFSRRFAAAKAADNVRAFVAGYAALGDAQRQVRRVAAALDDLWTVIDPAGMDADDVADLFELEERIARMAALVERDLRQREAARGRKERGTDRHGRDLRRPRPNA